MENQEPATKDAEDTAQKTARSQKVLFWAAIMGMACVAALIITTYLINLVSGIWLPEHHHVIFGVALVIAIAAMPIILHDYHKTVHGPGGVYSRPPTDIHQDW